MGCNWWCGSVPDRSRRDGESGQMMLLSAVLLIFAFLALSAMVARVAQLGSLTSQDRDRPVLLEIDVVQDAIDSTLLGLQAAAPAGAGLTNAALYEATASSLRHLEALERSRGFDLDWRLVNDANGAAVAMPPACGATVLAVEYSLDDGEVQVVLRSSATFTVAC